MKARAAQIGAGEVGAGEVAPLQVRARQAAPRTVLALAGEKRRDVGLRRRTPPGGFAVDRESYDCGGEDPAQVSRGDAFCWGGLHARLYHPRFGYGDGHDV